VGSPSNTKSPGPRPSSIPSGILIHTVIWPQQIWAENWGVAVPLRGGELGPHPTQCGYRAEAYLRAKFHFDPSNRLATAHERHRQTDCRDRQTGQTGQRSDSTGRTVLQTVAQKLLVTFRRRGGRPFHAAEPE